MPSRKVTVSAECCDPDTGEMQLTVDREGLTGDEAYEQMILHPAELHLLWELIGTHRQTGSGVERSLTFNVPKPG